MGYADGYEVASVETQWIPGCDLARIDGADGVGQCSIVFTPVGSVIHGYEHRVTMVARWGDERGFWPGLIEDIPVELQLKLVATPTRSCTPRAPPW
ncbi:hypothetical protein ACPA54_24455 [Uniformispora flossi]|uniref:hypothetical protein n=1 Tax=Uniformispora flossi TaxID=3390723 RepID=UPI003C2F1CB3